MEYLIYVVDDEESIRGSVTMAFEEEYNIKGFEDAESALENIEEDAPDLVLLDIGLPGMDGVEALEKIKHMVPDAQVIMITAYEDVDTVISAMKQGAEDYIIKPLEMDRLEITINNTLEKIRLRKKVQNLQEQYLQENLPLFIRESDALQEVMEFVEKVAKSPDTPIMIIGETGTGKELLAQAVHYRSPNFKGPFVPVNCAAVPKELIESELFGYTKGAFTGANKEGKKGMVEEAAEGTLFLDEVGDLSMEAQAKLLRFLETGEFYRVGSTEKKHIETRVVSATNKNLRDMIDKGTFREDLLFRLGVIRVKVPSLNERRDGIPALVDHFVNEYSKKFGKEITNISPDAVTALKNHNWTGNVRELKNVLEKAVLVCNKDTLDTQSLGLAESSELFEEQHSEQEGILFSPLTTEGTDLDESLQDLEEYYMKQAYEITNGNETKAAELLNLNHHTFRYRFNKLKER